MKKKLFIVTATLAACCAFGFASCKKDDNKPEAKEYTITFLVGGGEDDIVYTLKAGDGITAPAAPERDYYAFEGWYSDASLTIPYEFGTMPDADVTVYAKWAAQKRVRFYFFANGGDFGTENGNKIVSASQAFDVGGDTAPYETEPTRTGYKFDGWCLDAAGKQPYAFGEAPEKDVTLYAKWRKATSEYYYATFVVNGETLAEVPVKKGETLSAYDFDEQSGMVVDEWYEGDSSDSRTYDFSVAPSSNLQLVGYPYTKGLKFSADTVTGYDGTAEEAVIPARHNNSAITKIGDGAFRGNTAVVSVSLPDTVAMIGEYAFAECTYLKNIDLPERIVEIGAYAFYRNVRLQSAISLSGVKKVRAGAFNSCEKLTEVNFGAQIDEIGEYAFAGCSALKKAELPGGVMKIGNYAFADCSALTTFALPDSLASLGAGALRGCLGLQSISVAASNTAYAVKADGCLYTKDGKTLILYVKGNDVSYTVDGGVETILNGAFSCAGNLVSMTVGENVKTIANGALAGAKNLQTLTLPFLGGTAADADSGYLAYAFGAELASFNGETGKFTPASLKEVKILKAMTSVPDYAFYGCTALEKIEGIESATAYGNQAFAYTGFKAFTIPAAVTQIASMISSGSSEIYPYGQNVFAGCKALTEITVAAENANYASIDGCLYTKDGKMLLAVPAGKTEVTFASALEKIETCAFFDTLTERVTIPSSVKEINAAAFYRCTRIAEMTVPFIGGSESANTYMMYVFGAQESVPALLRKVTYTGAAKALPENAFRYLKGVTEVSYPDTVETIGNNAFRNTSIAEFSLGAGVKNIGEYAFAETKLTGEIVVPARIESLGAYAFAFNQSITKAAFEEGVKTIPEGAFYAYRSQASSNTYYYYSSLEEIVIPSSVESIGDGAFYYAGSNYTYDYAAGQKTDTVILNFADGSKLKSIGASAFAFSGVKRLSVPASVQTIGALAFFGCDQLEKAAIGTAEEGSAITEFSAAAFGKCNELKAFFVYKAVASSADVPAITDVTDSGGTYDYNLFYGYGKTPDIYVNGAEYYKAAAKWSEYAEKIAEIPQNTK